MWTAKEIPDQTGKTALVTGANTGIGFETARALYRAGAHVVVAGRDQTKTEQAVEKLMTADGSGTLEAGLLNLASLGDVKIFADQFKKEHRQLDLLINNAGVMTPPASKTEDGYELQFGVNFLGHFALTGHLYPLLIQSAAARVVTVSSGAHRLVESIDFENLKSEKSYDPAREYAISKLAGLLFMLELQRRLEQTGGSVISTAAHPGITKTELQRHMAEDDLKAAIARYGELMESWQGALPTLFAATSPTVHGGAYYGPDGDRELVGFPAPAKISLAAENQATAKKLWAYAEQVTGLYYPN